MSQRSKRFTVRVFVTLLAVLAFVLSYQHTVSWCQLWGPDDWRSYATAALPEGLVVLTILAWPEGQEWDDLVSRWSISGFMRLGVRLIPGLAAVAVTLWANGASAQGQGASALVVAMLPAAGAVMALALEVSLAQPGGEPLTLEGSDEPVSLEVQMVQTDLEPEGSEGSSEPVTLGQMDHEPLAHLTPVSRELEPRGPSVTPKDDPRVSWYLSLPEVPSATKIMAEQNVSLSTAKRIRAAAKALTERDTLKTEDV